MSQEESFAVCASIQHHGQTFEGAMEQYKTWVTSYDEDLDKIGYKAPQLVADHLAKQKPDKNDRILDVAAGTGLCAKILREKHGYTNIDALDASDVMLRVARDRKLYHNCFLCKIGSGHEAPFLEDTYDHITMSGGIAQGHIQLDAFEELIRIVKPGGYIVVSTREENRRKVPDYLQMDATFKKHEDDGLWRIVGEVITPNYYMEYEGVTWVFQVTKGTKAANSNGQSKASRK